jgi:hypothetical protein
MCCCCVCIMPWFFLPFKCWMPVQETKKFLRRIYIAKIYSIEMQSNGGNPCSYTRRPKILMITMNVCRWSWRQHRPQGREEVQRWSAPSVAALQFYTCTVYRRLLGSGPAVQWKKKIWTGVPTTRRRAVRWEYSNDVRVPNLETHVMERRGEGERT